MTPKIGKMTGLIMDDIDRRLLAILRVDGRASISNLSQQLKISRGTVQNRIDRLIANRVIEGFTVRQTASADANIVRAVMLIEITGQKTTALIRQLRGLPEIRTLYSTHGAWDLAAEIEAENLAQFDQIIRHIRSLDGVTKSETSLLLARL
jgi:DNA-binding Lrp family transcriptional regulator